MELSFVLIVANFSWCCETLEWIWHLHMKQPRSSRLQMKKILKNKVNEEKNESLGELVICMVRLLLCKQPARSRRWLLAARCGRCVQLKFMCCIAHPHHLLEEDEVEDDEENEEMKIKSTNKMKKMKTMTMKKKRKKKRRWKSNSTHQASPVCWIVFVNGFQVKLRRWLSRLLKWNSRGLSNRRF